MYIQKERQIYYDQRVFIESVDELRASFKYYNPEVKKIGIKTIIDFFEDFYVNYIKEIQVVQQTLLEELLGKLLYSNQNYDFDLEQCLKQKLEILKENLRYQYLKGLTEAEFFGEATVSEQETPKIIFPQGYEKEAFAAPEFKGNARVKKKVVYRGEEDNREEQELMSLDEHQHPSLRHDPLTVKVELKGTILRYGVKDKVIQPHMEEDDEELIPPENITIGNQVIEFVEKISNVMEIRNYKLNLVKKANGKELLLMDRVDGYND